MIVKQECFNAAKISSLGDRDYQVFAVLSPIAICYQLSAFRRQAYPLKTYKVYQTL